MSQSDTKPTKHTEDSSKDGKNGGDEKPDRAQIEHEIEVSREQLGETVEALTAKLDVKGRTKARISHTTDRGKQQVGALQKRAVDLTHQARSAATTDEGKPKTAVSAGAAGVVVAALVVAGLLVWRARR